MGFNIGRFFGSIAPEVGGAVGGFFGGALGAAAGQFVGTAIEGELAPSRSAATVGRATQPGPVSSRASFGTTRQFSGGGTFRPSSTVPVKFGLGSLRGLQRGGTALTLFGNGNGNGQNPVARILQKAREATGGPVTRNRIIDAAKACGLELAASTFGLDVTDVCMVVVKGRTRRRRGVSAADIRRTKRTINFASKVRKDLKALAR